MLIEPLPPAHVHFPNCFAHYFLHSLEIVMGKNGIAGALKQANLAHLIEHYPPDNDDSGFDYAEFSMLNAGLEALIGRRLGRGFGRRAGRHMLQNHLSKFGGVLANIDPQNIQALPIAERIKITLPLITLHIIQGGQPPKISTIRTTTDALYIELEQCPACWARVADNRPGTGADEPVCATITGMYEGALASLSNGRKFRVTETSCIAQGATCCVFEIAREPFG
jgi:hypothetical protein